VTPLIRQKTDVKLKYAFSIRRFIHSLLHQ
jgi:hypothetical protein